MQSGEEFFNPSEQALQIFDYEKDEYLSVEHGQFFIFLHMRPEGEIPNNPPPTAVVEFEGRKCWMRMEKFDQVTLLEPKSEKHLLIWLGDNSTYEELSVEGGPTITTLNEDGMEAVEGGHELKDFTSEEMTAFVEKEVPLAEVLAFYLHHWPNAL